MNRIPRTLPANKNPPVTRCIQITIPDDDEYERDLNSVIQRELATWLSWERDLGKNGTVVARLWKTALATWKHCSNEKPVPAQGLLPEEEMFRRGCINNKCYVEFECCPGEWIRLANESQLGQSGQPGGTVDQPKPGGPPVQYCYTLQANQILYMPVTVSSGDLITFDSGEGSGWDGVETDSFGAPIYRCYLGDVFFGGSCSGGRVFHSGDPISGNPHMAVILRIGSTDYSMGPGSFIVPSGFTNAPFSLLVNDSSLANNMGNYYLCVSVKNNAVGTFSHLFDFTISPQGWDGSLTGGGIWYSGQGWGNAVATGNNYIEITVPRSVAYTRVEVTYISGGSSAGTSLSGGVLGVGNILSIAPVDVSGVNVLAVGTVPQTGSANLAFAMVGDPTVQSYIRSIKIFGAGSDPF